MSLLAPLSKRAVPCASKAASQTWIALGCGILLAALLARFDIAHAADADRWRTLLRVQPGATCLSSDALVPQIEQWLDGVSIGGGVRIEVEGSATDPHSARVRVVRAGQVVAHRAFEPGPARCSHLQAAVSLAIALAIKASLVEELGRPLPDDPAARAESWSLSGSALLTYHLLPALAPGIELTARRAFGKYVALRMGAIGVMAFGADLEQQAGTFNATVVAARVDACAYARLARTLRAGLCVGGLGGMLYAAGADVTRPTSSVVGLIALSNAVELELELSRRWSLLLDFSLTFLLHRVEVGVVDASGEPLGSRALDSPGFALGLGPGYYF